MINRTKNKWFDSPICWTTALCILLNTEYFSKNDLLIYSSSSSSLGSREAGRGVCGLPTQSHVLFYGPDHDLGRNKRHMSVFRMKQRRKQSYSLSPSMNRRSLSPRGRGTRLEGDDSNTLRSKGREMERLEEVADERINEWSFLGERLLTHLTS